MRDMMIKITAILSSVLVCVLVASCERNGNESLVEQYSSVKNAILIASVDFECAGISWRYEKSLISEKLLIKDDLGWKSISDFSSDQNGIVTSIASWRFDVSKALAEELNSNTDLPNLNPRSFFDSKRFFKTQTHVIVPAQIKLDLYDKMCTAVNLFDTNIETTFMAKEYINTQLVVEPPVVCPTSKTLEDCVKIAPISAEAHKVFNRYSKQFNLSDGIREDKRELDASENHVRVEWGRYQRELERRGGKLNEIVESVPLKKISSIEARQLVESFPVFTK